MNQERLRCTVLLQWTVLAHLPLPDDVLDAEEARLEQHRLALKGSDADD